MKKLIIIISAIVTAIVFVSCSLNSHNDLQDTTAEQIKESIYTDDSTEKSSPATDAATDADTGAYTDAATPDTSAVISRENAIDAALKAAGLTREAVYDLEAELDREKGVLLWEVDFDTREYEYSYHIDAETGAVIRQEKDIND